MIEINGNLINEGNISYVDNYMTDTDGYAYKRTYHINIYFVGSEKQPLVLKTYDREEFDGWWNALAGKGESK